MVGLMILQEKAKATEAYRAKLIEGMNGPLIMDFREGINNLRERALEIVDTTVSHKATTLTAPMRLLAYQIVVLGNLGTLPSYKRQGTGTALTRCKPTHCAAGSQRSPESSSARDRGRTTSSFSLSET